MKLTPLKEKKDKEEQPKPTTPIRAHHVTRAVALQARKSGLTPDAKGEARKAGEHPIRRKATPRRIKKDEGDDKHVKLEDSGQSSSSEHEHESSDDGEKVQPADIVKVEEGDKNISDNNKELDNLKDEQPTVIPDKIVTEVKEVKEVTTFVVPNKPAQAIVETPVEREAAKENEESSEESKMSEQEQETMDLYEHLWAMENKLRNVC